MKRLPVLVLAALGLTFGACGGDGGGGDEEAFCSDLEVLSDQVSDGDLADSDGLEDALDTANSLAESAEEGDQLDAVNTVQDELGDASPDDADDTAETIQDELGDFAEDCDIDEDDFAVGPTTTTTEGGTTTTEGGATTTGGGDTTTTGGGGDDIASIVVHERSDIPGDIAPEFAALAQACFDGSMLQCDELFNTTPAGSTDEDYGDTCAGRIDDGQGFDLECADVITPPVDVPAEVVDQATASACFSGDMVACDTLFQASPEDSIDETYGALCAGRVQNTDALCVDIFGEQANL